LELEMPQQPVCEVVQPQEQTHFQVKGVQPVEAPNNEPQQKYLFIRYLHSRRKEKNNKNLQLVDF
jgi:hypothetical protein